MNTVVRSLSTAVKKLDLNGIFVPLITPFTSGGKIDFDKVEKNVYKFEKEANLTGYVVGGSNSEVATLTPDERIDLVSRIRKLVKPQKVILGGATSESTELAYKMSKDMAKAGADGVLIMTPFYFKKLMTEDVIANHFTRIADESPIPIVLYNMPFISGIDIGIGLLKRLAKHPNIRGVKDSDIRKMAVTVEETKGLNFNVLAGSAGYLLPALQVGCTGGIVALAGPLGPEVCKLHQLVTERKWEEAIALQNKLIPIDLMLPATFGVPGVKAAMKLKGFDSGHCRLPLVDANQEDTALIKNTLAKLGFL